MLDFGFSEILLTSAIALVVLGPERLPKVARQVGTWMGRARVMARQLSEQLEREVNAEELLREQKKIAAMLDQPVIKPGELDALISGTSAAGASAAPNAPADSPPFPASGSPATASAPPPAAAPTETTRALQ